MATLEFPRKGSGNLAGAPVAGARIIDVTVDLSKDVTMGTATDVINVFALPAGTVVLAATIEQISAGTGSGTLVARVGSTTVSATLASTAAVGTVAAAAAVDTIITTAETELNLLGATAVRTDGKVRVVAVVAELTKSPATAVIAQRDTSL